MTTALEAFERALKDRPGGVSPLTVRGYMADVKKFAEWFQLTNGETMRTRNVTPVDVRDYKAHLQTQEKFKPSTINRRLAALRVYFDWAVATGLVKETPVKVRGLDEPKTAPRSIDDRTYHRLLLAARNYGNSRDVAIIQLLRHAGLRVNELCSLEMTDITLSERKLGRVVVRSGKGRRYREVPLNKEVQRALRDYFTERPKVDDLHVFIGQRKNGLTDAAVQDLVAKYARIAGIEEISPHVLRHTFGRGLVDKGVDLPTVQQLMGHQRLDSTARYTKPSQRDLEVAVSRLEIEEV